MEYFIFLPASPGAGERWWFCALCSELSTEGPWPRRAGVPGAKAAVEFGHCSPRVKFSKPCLISEVPDRAGVSASPCSEALLVPPWERIPWDHWYPLGTAHCEQRSRNVMAEAEHGVFFSSEWPLLNLVQKVIPGLVSVLEAAHWRSNPGLLEVFGAATGKSTSSALPEQVSSAGICSPGTTAVTAARGICWPRAQGRRNPSTPAAPGSGTAPWIKGTASRTAKSSLFTLQEGPDKTAALPLNPAEPSDCQGFPVWPTLMDFSNFKSLPLHWSNEIGLAPATGTWECSQRVFNILLCASPTFWHFHKVALKIHSLGIIHANHRQD